MGRIGALCLTVLVVCGCDMLGSPGKDVAFNLTVHPVASWAELKSAVEDLAGADIIGVVDGFTTSALPADTIAVRRPVTVTAYKGTGTITRHSGFTSVAQFFKVETGGRLVLGHPQGGTLILDGNNIPLSGGSQFIGIDNNGACVLRDGVILQGNNLSSAVDAAGGEFIMEGGIIRGNTASASGSGGVLVRNTARFTMNGGTITGNKGPAGGVRLQNTSTFKMNGGTIRGNENNAAPGGGGVRMETGTTFEMTGGTISGNRTPGTGGGINFSGTGSLNLAGGTVGGNTSGGDGGGVWYTGTGTIRLAGTRISGNTASGSININGGGAFISSGTGGTVTITGGTIESNTVTTTSGAAAGGGMHLTLANSATCTLSGLTIRNNTASGSTSAQGIGLYLALGTGTIAEWQSGVISGNAATAGGTNGGGIYVSLGSGTFLKTGGTIYGNDAPAPLANTAAGGAAVYAGARFRNSTAWPIDDLDSADPPSTEGWD